MNEHNSETKYTRNIKNLLLSLKKEDGVQHAENQLVEMGEVAIPVIAASMAKNYGSDSNYITGESIRFLEHQVKILGRIGNPDGADVVLHTLVASAIWATNLHMLGTYGYPGKHPDKIMFDTPTSRIFRIRASEDAKSLKRACITALTQIGPTVLPLIQEHIKNIKESNKNDWDKKYALRSLRRAYFRLSIKRWLHF